MDTDAVYMDKSELGRLISCLKSSGYVVIGPKVEESAIVYAEIDTIDDLPLGYRDAQQPGQYRVTQSGSSNYFEFNVGPYSWKQFLFPPKLTVASGKRESGTWTFETPDEPQPKFAFLGVRACELAAIAVQDRVFMEGAYVDPVYRQRRQSALIIAVNCTVAASTCFCTSMQTGPECHQGFDLALTEIDDGFVVEVGSERAEPVVSELQVQPISSGHLRQAQAGRQRAAEQITKRLDTTDVRDILLENLDHPHWDDVATRCLSCTNCTLVCPTCFCSSVTEVSDISGDSVERQRQWDSCFNIDFSYTASGVVRNDRRSRFRQWLTHKLASWHDQFDTSGCVGCGRCITWCPVGIDLTEEVAAIRRTPPSSRVLPIVEPAAKAACVVEQEARE